MVMSVAVCERSGLDRRAVHIRPRSTRGRRRTTSRSGYSSAVTTALLPTSILFPVYFRHPEARPLTGNTIQTIAETPISGAQPKVGENKR